MPPKRARSRSVAIAPNSSDQLAISVANVQTETSQPAESLASQPGKLVRSATSTSSQSKQQQQREQQQVLLNMYSLFSEKDVLGTGIERLLAFHGIFGDGTGDMDKWTAAVAKYFTPEGTLRLDMGTQSFDVPVCTVGRFYHQMFGDGGISSMHIALGPAKAHCLRNSGSLVSFHGVMVTSTYATGRRVIETGALRVIFASDFRIRVWAFTAADATICLPRKRPNGQDDAPIRTAEATIARNLDWPNTELPLPKRRKSAHGRQPPEECVLPAGALRHAEVASTMYCLRNLIELQLQNPASSVASLLEMWAAAENVAPAKEVTAKNAVEAGSFNERKRVRKRSIAAANNNNNTLSAASSASKETGKNAVSSSLSSASSKQAAIVPNISSAASASATASVSVAKTGL
ncbi:hypothetical protein J3B02_003507 [Coemansia erecta]|nr:hypothetical protein J3B02_003507 [Coemansia erecta]